MIRMFAAVASLSLLVALPAHAQTLDKAERACASSKLKATGKKAAAKLKCEATAVKKEMAAADPECMTKAEDKFMQAFAKAEAKGGCVSDGDAAAVEANVDDFVQEEVVRQRTGSSLPPSCPTLLAPCGSCAGGGGCVTHVASGQNACVAISGAMPVVCADDGDCPDGRHCVSVSGGVTACLLPCP